MSNKLPTNDVLVDPHYQMNSANQMEYNQLHQSNVKPWTQPLFLVYDVSKDERVPLTQERLDVLLAVEQAYGRLRGSIEGHHQDLNAKIRHINSKDGEST